MQKMLLELINKLTDEEFDSLYVEDIFDINLPFVNVDLLSLRFDEYLHDIEDDIKKAVISYILLRDTNYPPKMIYDYVFKKGKTILWN